jgi:putative inorganic carbon (HCO3(-)) transporter
MAVQSPLSYLDITIGFSNYRFLNHAQTALLPLLTLLIMQVPGASRARRLACFALVAFWWAVLFFVEARASILGLLIACLATLAVRRRQALPFLKTMALAAVCGAFIYLVLFIVAPALAGMSAFGVPGKVLARTVADPTSGRNFLWKLALELIAHHPVLGVGPQHFAHAGANLGWGAHPHDWILQIATEWGVPALLCLAAMLALGVRGLLRAGAAIDVGDKANQAICTALLVAVLAIVVDGLFSGVLVMPQSQLAIVLVFGITTGWVRSQQTAGTPQASGALRLAGTLLVLTALSAVAVTAAPDFMRRWEDAPMTAQELAHNRDDFHWPRLWSAGYF